MDVPGPVRVLALVLAGLLLLLHGGSLVSALTEPASNEVGWIMALGHGFILALLLPPLVWVAASPRRAGRFLHDRLGLDLSQTSHVLAALVHLAFLYIVFGLTALTTAHTASTFLSTGKHPAEGSVLNPDAIIQGLLMNLALFFVAAVTWLMLVEGRQGQQVWEDLGLPLNGLPRGLVWGVLATLAIFVVLVGLGYLLEAAGYAPENPQAEAISAALSPTTAVLVAALAGLGEELYFRGFLLPRTGNLVQAVLFGLIHATYLTPFQVILPTALGLAFGVLRTRVNLWAPVAAHTLFNAVMLLSTIYGDELAFLPLF